MHQTTSSTGCSVPRTRAAARLAAGQPWLAPASWSQRTPSGVSAVGAGTAWSPASSRARITEGTMTMSPRSPTRASERPSTRAEARSKSTRPSTSSGMNRGGRRVAHVVATPASSRSAAIWAPELPPPTTRTRRPANASGERYAAECRCVPPKRSAPGRAGTNGRVNEPVAETTARALRAVPSSSRRVNGGDAAASCVTAVTRTPRRTGRP